MRELPQCSSNMLVERLIFANHRSCGRGLIALSYCFPIAATRGGDGLLALWESCGLDVETFFQHDLGIRETKHPGLWLYEVWVDWDEIDWDNLDMYDWSYLKGGEVREFTPADYEKFLNSEEPFDEMDWI